MFGQSIGEAKVRFGTPIKEDKTRKGQTQLHYAEFILRFDEQTSLFKEFTALPECELVLEGKTIPWNEDFLTSLYQSDKEMVDLYGFIVSFKNGLSVSGFHDGDDAGKAIHVFQRGVWVIEPDDQPKPWRPL